MTDININTLPLAKRGQALNRVIGTQVDDNGVASLALFPLKTLSATGGRIARLAIATTPAPAGTSQDATLTVYTDDGNSYPVIFTIPPGARGFSVDDVACEQDEVKPGEACRVRLTLTLDNGEKLPPMVLTLPPGKDSLTVTGTSVTQGPVEPGKPSRVTVTNTHSDGSQASYSYDAPPGVEGFVDSTRFVAHDHGDMTMPTIHYGPDDSYTLTPQSDGNFVAYDDKRNVIFALNDKEGFIGRNRIATTADVKADVQTETIRAQDVEAGLISGTLGMGAQSTPGRGLHTSGTGRANYVDNSGSRGDLAYYTDIQAETKRAQNAEANTVKTETKSNENPVDLLVFNNQEGTLAAHDSLAGRWHSHYTTEDSVKTATFSDADVKPTTIRVYKNEDNNGTPQLILQNNGFRDFVGPSLDYVNQEITRAQAAEANLLPLSGGTINGVIRRAGGGALPEVLGVDGSRVVIQAFTAYVKFGQGNPKRISFPQSFAPGTIPIVSLAPTTEVIGQAVAWNCHVIMKKSSTELDIDNSGFSCGSYAFWNNIKSSGEDMIPIIAIGVM